MPKTPSLAEMAPHLIPKQWADSPRERSKQMHKLQAYLARESVFSQEEREEKKAGIELTRGLFMVDNRAYYGGLTSPIDQALDTVVNNVVGPLENWFDENIIDPFTSYLGDIWSTVRNIATTIYNQAYEAVSRAIEGLVGTASDIWDTIKNIATTIYNQAYSAISEAIKGVVSTTQSIWGAVQDFGQKVFQYTKRALDAALDPVWSIFEAMKRYIGQIWSALKQGANVLVELPQKIWSGLRWLGKQLQQLPTKIWRGIQELANWIKQIPGKLWQGMKQLGGWLVSSIHEALPWGSPGVLDMLQQWLGAAWSYVKSGLTWLCTKVFDVLHWAFHQVTPYAQLFADAIAGGMREVMQVIGTPLADFYKWIMKELVAQPLKQVRGEGRAYKGIDDMIDATGEVAEELYITLREGIEYEPPATFEKAQDAAGDFLTYGLIFGGMDSIVTMGEEIWDKLRGFTGGAASSLVNKMVGYAETVNPFQQYHKLISSAAQQHFGGIAKFFKSAYYALGLGFMMWTIWSGSLRAIMADPREEHYRRVYKTKYPEPSTFKDAFTAQMTLPTDNQEWLSMAGYNPMYRDMIEQLSWNRLSRTQIEDWYDQGLITDKELWDHVKWLGYKPKVARKLVENIKQKSREPKHEDIADKVQDAYKKGLFQRDEAKDWLRAHGYNGPLAEWYTYAIDIEAEVEDAQAFIDAIDDKYDDKLSELADRFEEGEISEDEFIETRNKMEHNYESDLTKYMTRQDRVEAKMNQWKWSNLPKQWLHEVSPLKNKIQDLEQELRNKKQRRQYLINRRKEERETYTARAKVIKERMSEDARKLQREIESTRKERERELEGKRADYADNVANAVMAQNEPLAHSVTVPWTAVVNQLQKEPNPDLPEPKVSMSAIKEAVNAEDPALIDQIKTDIENIKEEYRNRINRLQAQLKDIEPVRAARLQRLRENKEDKILYYDRRISDLENEIEKVRNKLEATRRAKGAAS